MRKLITILLITTFVALALVACAGTPVKTETPATDGTQQTNTPTADGTEQPSVPVQTDDESSTNNGEKPLPSSTNDEGTEEGIVVYTEGRVLWTERTPEEEDEFLLANYHEPTIEENFHDDQLFIVLKHDFYGMVNLDYLNKFDNTTIVSFTYDGKIFQNVNDKLYCTDPYDTGIRVSLSTHDKQIVLDLCHSIMQWDDVLLVTPRYIKEAKELYVPAALIPQNNRCI